jgi:S-formylglutathione hydrolase FrmB
MRARWLVFLPAILVAACGAAPYDSTQDAHVVRYALPSRLMKRSLEQVLVVPAGPSAGRPLVVLLHGRSAGADQFLGDPMFTELTRLGRKAPLILIPSGGDHSYWHDRTDGPWGSYVVHEAIPAALARTHADARRIAIGGASMGGFGALDLARLRPGRFCAVGAHSAAIWPTAARTASGAFDDPADFSRHDVMGAAARGNPYGRVPILVDVGRDDGFRSADERLANDLRAHGADVTFHLDPGGHSGWRDRMGRYLAFYADALARCRTRTMSTWASSGAER